MRIDLTASWSPINDNHAIVVMAASIRFSEPVPDRLLKRALTAVEPALQQEGFKSRHNAKRVTIRVQANGGGIPELTESVGQLFNRQADNAEAIEDRVIEQIVIDNESVVYRTWDYISWQWHFDRIKALLAPAIEVISPSVNFQSVGVEYLDKFVTSGVAPAPVAELLCPSSGLVADHIFGAPDLFHCHTGAFRNTDAANLLLQVVKVDATREDDQLVVSITTTQERKYADDGAENPEVFEVFAEAHKGLKELLGRVITLEQANRIYLQG